MTDDQVWPFPAAIEQQHHRALRVFDTPIYVARRHEDWDQVVELASDACRSFARLVTRRVASPELHDWSTWISQAPEDVIAHWLRTGITPTAQGPEVLEAALDAVESDDPSAIACGLSRVGWAARHRVVRRLAAYRGDIDAVIEALLDPGLIDARNFVAHRIESRRPEVAEQIAAAAVGRYADQVNGVLAHYALRVTGWAQALSGGRVDLVAEYTGSDHRITLFNIVATAAEAERLLGFRAYLVLPGDLGLRAEWARTHQAPWGSAR